MRPVVDLQMFLADKTILDFAIDLYDLWGKVEVLVHLRLPTLALFLYRRVSNVNIA